jgi:hypothetical protein
MMKTVFSFFAGRRGGRFRCNRPAVGKSSILRPQRFKTKYKVLLQGQAFKGDEYSDFSNQASDTTEEA